MRCLPAEVDNASEYRYRAPIIGPDTLVVSVSQSGETVDTLAAMEEAKRQGALQITICNIVGSQATRVADGVVYTRCGLEIGVCSTKTFTASVTASYLLACYLGQARGLIDQERMGGLLEPLARVPYLAGEMTKREAEFERLAHQFHRYNNFLYLGRGIQFPVAMEGALKLKEISYIHAEGYPAGEMKHGAIALIDPEMPVIAIALKDEMHDKTARLLYGSGARSNRSRADGRAPGTARTGALLGRRDDQAGGRVRAAGPPVSPLQQLPLPGPRHPVSGGHGGRP